MSDARERTLGALHTLRELDEARAQASWAAAERSVQRRRDALQAQEAALCSHQARTRHALTPRTPWTPPSHTGEREDAAALQQRELYRLGRARTEARLRAALSAARRALAEAEARLADARAALGASHAQRRAVEREHDRQVQRDLDRRTRG